MPRLQAMTGGTFRHDFYCATFAQIFNITKRRHFLLRNIASDHIGQKPKRLARTVAP
jgi:hypothetical protein